MKQLTATNNLTGMKIIQRYVKGSRYLKVIPSTVTPLVLEGLKKQFKESPVEIEESKTGWIKISKKDKDPKLEKAVKKLVEKEGKDSEDINEEYVLNKEAEILKKQGFVVKLEEVKLK